MPDHRISWTTLIAVVIATTAALVARAWLQVHLVDTGTEQQLAGDISYLIVPPILLVLLFPLWRSERSFLTYQFRRQALGWQTALTAVAIGVLLRLMWWSQAIAGASFGLYRSANPNAVVGPDVSFQCAAPHIVILGFFVFAILIPAIEEITHRGYLQTALHRLGPAGAILVSAAIFAVFHRLDAWPVAFFAGLVFGVQFWATRSLWFSIITHATVNGLIQLDWRCLSIRWNPQTEDLPVWLPGMVSLAVFAACLVGLLLLLRNMITGAQALRPGNPASTAR